MEKREKNVEELLRAIKFKPNVVVNPSEVDASYQAILGRIDTSSAAEPVAARKFKLFSSPFIRYAASVAIFVTLSIFGYRYYVDSKIVTVANALNEVKELSLPDGSKIWLRANSQISYSENFNTNRSVEIKGEALFEVHKDKNHPFSVQTKCGKITVLGTVFTVRANDNENFTKTLLKEGSIRFADTNNENEVVLLPGYEAIRQANTDKAQVSKVENMDRQLAWKTRNFKFENESFSEIIAVLADAFNTKIVIADTKLGAKRYTVKFNRKESLSQILDVLSQIADFKIQQKQDSYYLN